MSLRCHNFILKIKKLTTTLQNYASIIKYLILFISSVCAEKDSENKSITCDRQAVCHRLAKVELRSGGIYEQQRRAKPFFS